MVSRGLGAIELAKIINSSILFIYLPFAAILQDLASYFTPCAFTLQFYDDQYTDKLWFAGLSDAKTTWYLGSYRTE